MEFCSAVVTGGASEVGLAIARAFAWLGTQVVLADLPGDALRAMSHATMTSEDVAACVVAGIQQKDFHILTHPESLSLARQRWQRLLDDIRVQGAQQR
ncbi:MULTISPECIES: hypothetical protein [unclassified Pseudomonas]|uniref:hypothetical protein n=1 Tax=unclassified Pseudomonas TaxID=196821 RepID=UPI0025FA3567|nr:MULTISPECIES: hypothetical protein [unclassified Pseudomonas]